jgi:hypothetical protein
MVKARTREEQEILDRVARVKRKVEERVSEGHEINDLIDELARVKRQYEMVNDPDPHVAYGYRVFLERLGLIRKKEWWR